MTDALTRDLAGLPHGARLAVAAWCGARIEKLRDELEAAESETQINRVQGGIAELRDFVRRLEYREEK